MTRNSRAIATLAIAIGALSATAQAATVTQAIDNAVTSGPLSSTAASTFDASVPGMTIVDFESFATGALANPTAIAPGVTISFTGGATDGFGPAISSDVSLGLGFNTTAAGSKHLRLAPDFDGPDLTVTFTFATPIDAFGFFHSGTQSSLPGTFTVEFDDGTTQSIAMTENDNSGGVGFFGITDFASPISSLTIHEAGPFPGSRDLWGIDDIRFRTAAADVPAPASLALLGAALAGLATTRRARRTA